MDCRALPFSRLPHQSRLFLAYLEDFESVKAFYAHSPGMESMKDAARRIEYPEERRKIVGDVLRRQNIAFGASSAVMENLTKLEKGAIAIVTGQQVGLFGGPAFAIYKALTAIQCATDLTREGIEAVPVFWMATEDHDVDEVRHATFFVGGKLSRFELPAPPKNGCPVGQIPLGAAVKDLTVQVVDILSAQGSGLLAEMVAKSYRAEETYSTAFGKLFAQLFAQHGLILLDPMDAELHRVAAPVYAQAVAEREILNEKLLQRGKELERRGFAAQVKVTSRSTLLFYTGDGPRQVVNVAANRFQAGPRSWKTDELQVLIEEKPEAFSPNALLRPVVQDYLLPTAAYIGGPSEICYFAQSEVLYGSILGRMPVLLPRAAFTLVDPKASKLLTKYGLIVEDVWMGAQELRRKMEAKSISESVAIAFEKLQEQMREQFAKLRSEIEGLDPTLQGAVDTAQKKMVYQLERLRGKAGRARDARSGLIAAHSEYLESLLYPHKQLQSRELCILPLLARWGPGGLDDLQKHATPGKLGQHFIVPIS
jgi:bacillithiol biosynthesis cysteine-adding enzyme BshC